MKNITRTVTDYLITAYDLVDGENGPEVKIVDQTSALAVSMTKSEARAALAEAMGTKLPKGLTIKWKPQATYTYAMPLEKFLDQAVVIKEGE